VLAEIASHIFHCHCERSEATQGPRRWRVPDKQLAVNLRDERVPVLVDALNQIGGDAAIERSIPLARHEVNSRSLHVLNSNLRQRRSPWVASLRSQ